MSNSAKIFFKNQQLTSISTVVGNPQLEIQKMWRIFRCGLNSVFELRALWPKGWPNKKPPVVRHYQAAAFPSLDACKAAFEAEALKLNAEGYNIYTLLNPLKPTFSCKGAAKNEDIACRRHLLIDIDRVGETSEPATDSEVAHAKGLAKKIFDYMADRGWPDPIVMMSGNGYHLYYALDERPNDQESEALIKDVLLELSDEFDTHIVGVDTVVYNAARITKVPGTIMRKGEESVARPYRMAEVCDEI